MSITGRATPVVVPATAFVPTPGVDTSTDLEVFPATIEAVVSVATPGFLSDTAPNPAAVIAAAAVPVPSMLIDGTATPAAVEVAASVPEPQVVRYAPEWLSEAGDEWEASDGVEWPADDAAEWPVAM
jgi:hypothetical protein